jgi:hypothetical protein
MNHFVDRRIETLRGRFCKELNVITGQVAVSHVRVLLDREVPIEIQLPFEVFFQLLRFFESDLIDPIGGRQMFVGDFHIHDVLTPFPAPVWRPSSSFYSRFGRPEEMD